tara:strand:+ start:409125 stop:410153 length:1029 start_codon:yes stop_codon:yes gene_type:complete
MKNFFINRRIMQALSLALLCTSAQLASAQCMQSDQLKGVNISGAEFKSKELPGKQDKDYVYPNSADLDFVKSIGGNVIRLPFLWERIQPELNAPLNQDVLNALHKIVDGAYRRGLCVILDVHNYAAYRGKPLGSTTVPATAFYDLWTRLAQQFPEPEQTIFGLMNEPAKISIDQWAPIAQQAVNAIRKSGSKNIILVAGGRWSGAHEWLKPQGATSSAIAFARLTDPLQRTWLEAHQYADSDYSGTKYECVDADKMKRIFGGLTTWAKENRQRLFLGEFGVAPNEKCLTALDTMLTEMQDKTVWRGWTYWTAGRWWGDYPMSIQPKNGTEAAQITVLKKYLK